MHNQQLVTFPVTDCWLMYKYKDINQSAIAHNIANEILHYHSLSKLDIAEFVVFATAYCNEFQIVRFLLI